MNDSLISVAKSLILALLISMIVTTWSVTIFVILPELKKISAIHRHLGLDKKEK